MRSGPRSPFGPKELPTRSHSLTKDAKRLLELTAKRIGSSQSNIVEVLIRKFSHKITPQDFPK